VKDVVIYTMAACGPCVRAKALLRRKGVPFREIDAGSDAGIAADVARRSGRMTLPQIFADGEPLGGSDDLHALEREGRLDAALGLS
jgi:glutaredoxin 3